MYQPSCKIPQFGKEIEAQQCPSLLKNDFIMIEKTRSVLISLFVFLTSFQLHPGPRSLTEPPIPLS